MIIQLQCRSTIIRNKSFIIYIIYIMKLIIISYTYLHQNNFSIAAENTWTRCLVGYCNLCLVPVVVTVWWPVPPWMYGCWYCLYQPKILILGPWWCGWERSPLRTLVVETESSKEYTYDGRPLPTTGIIWYEYQYRWSMLNSYKQKHAALKRDLDSGGDGKACST